MFDSIYVDEQLSYSGNIVAQARDLLMNCDHKVDMEREIDNLWAKIHARIETKRSGVAKRMYGHREDFQRHGLAALTDDEMVPVNEKIADSVQFYREAMQKIPEIDFNEFLN